MSEVKFFDASTNGALRIITVTDEAWVFWNDVWTNLGSYPGAPVPLKEESWGRVKDRYRN